MRAALPLAALIFLAGCTSLFTTADRPESLDPVPVDASPYVAYDEALALAFDRGWNILYTSEEERIIELDRIDSGFLQSSRVRRLDILVRERGGQSYIHARYHSFTRDNPDAISVEREDRRTAQDFVDELVNRLTETAEQR